MRQRQEQNWVAWLMRNYRLTFLLVGLLMLLGFYGLDRMPKAEFPDFTIRQGVVVGIYPGATSEEEIGSQIIYSDQQGHTVRVRDIARIERGYDLSDGFVEYNGRSSESHPSLLEDGRVVTDEDEVNGHRCVILSMEMLEGNNIVQYGRDVDEVLSRFREDVLPQDVTINRISDQPKFVGQSVSLN